jgi:hypothetical protein
MINLNSEVGRLKKKYGISSQEFEISIVNFFVSNNWFGEKPIVEKESVFVNDEFLKKQGGKIEEFCRFFGSDTKTKINYLESKIENELPETFLIFQKYCATHELDNNIVYYLLDFLLYNCLEKSGCLQILRLRR